MTLQNIVIRHEVKIINYLSISELNSSTKEIRANENKMDLKKKESISNIESNFIDDRKRILIEFERII